jgi:hypothetical protein
MKNNRPLACLAFIASACLLSAASTNETGVVTENRINVRGQAALFGEVITQLQKGEKVSILEEITLQKPKTNEPPKWFRIQMPANTPVWIFASFVDPANKTVNVPKLNLRAGPGENYSVVGRLERGDTVKDIRTVDGWMEIETPVGAYGFVAAELVAKSSTNAPPTFLEKPVVPPIIPPTVAKTESPALPEATKITEPPSAVLESNTLKVEIIPPPSIQTNAPGTNLTINPAPAIVSATTNTPPAPSQPEATTPAQVPIPAKVTPDTAPKRIVRREGIVRSTKSIQAPTYFELVSAETRKVINYLHVEDVGLSIKDFKGKKIIVTGEESIDARWPKTPLIEIETLELAP